MKHSSRSVWSAVVIAAIVLIGAALARAQSRGEITRVTIDPASLPLPVLSPRGGPFERGGIYEVYLTSPVEFPGKGLAQKVFIQVDEVSPDGWLRVEYGSGVVEPGDTRAALADPATLEITGQVPRVNVQLTLRYTMIAAMSVRLNADTQMARYWPQ